MHIPPLVREYTISSVKSSLFRATGIVYGKTTGILSRTDGGSFDEIKHLLMQEAFPLFIYGKPILLRLRHLSFAEVKDDKILLKGKIHGIDTFSREEIKSLIIVLLDSRGKEIARNRVLAETEGKAVFEITMASSKLKRVTDFKVMPTGYKERYHFYYRLYPENLVRTDSLSFSIIHKAEKSKERIRIEEDFARLYPMEESKIEDVLRFLEMGREIAAIYHNSSGYPRNCGEISVAVYYLMQAFNLKPIILSQNVWCFNDHLLNVHTFPAFKTEGIIYFLDVAADQNNPLPLFIIGKQAYSVFGRISPVILPLGIIAEKYHVFAEQPQSETKNLRNEDLSPYVWKMIFPSPVKLDRKKVYGQARLIFKQLIKRAKDQRLLRDASSADGGFVTSEFGVRSSESKPNYNAGLKDRADGGSIYRGFARHKGLTRAGPETSSNNLLLKIISTDSHPAQDGGVFSSECIVKKFIQEHAPPSNIPTALFILVSVDNLTQKPSQAILTVAGMDIGFVAAFVIIQGPGFALICFILSVAGGEQIARAAGALRKREKGTLISYIKPKNLVGIGKNGTERKSDRAKEAELEGIINRITPLNPELTREIASGVNAAGVVAYV